MFKFKGSRFFAVLLTLAMVVSLLAGCGGGSTTTTETKPAETTKEAAATPKVVKIGMVTSQTGALQAYGAQTNRGFKLGFEYYTKGTNKIGNTEIQLVFEDSENKPEVAKQKAIKLYEEDKVDILVGCASSSDALAIEPLAEEYKKIFICEPAVADAITGSAYNKYTFRTGRNSSQDAVAAAASVAKKGAKLGVFAPDSAFGHDGADAFKAAAIKAGAEIVYEAYPAADATDFTPEIQKMIAAKPESVFVIWAGANSPWKAFMDAKVGDKGINLSTGAPDIAALKTMFANVGMKGFCVYYYGLPKNDVNDWLIEHEKSEFNTVPDLFDAGGFAAAAAICTALEKSNGETDPEKLIPIMEGMQFKTPKGTMTFRKEDHQALQAAYAITLKKLDGYDYPVPVLDRELSPEETAPPIRNKK